MDHDPERLTKDQEGTVAAGGFAAARITPEIATMQHEIFKSARGDWHWWTGFMAGISGSMSSDLGADAAIEILTITRDNTIKFKGPQGEPMV